jgi:chemotaxis methyl-accepting protein methylase
VAELADALRVGETSFFRDREQWRAIEGLVASSRSIRSFAALSAGCSTGEETWSLALALERVRGESPRRVVGMDRSAGALAAAEAGIYAADALKDLPPAELEAHFVAQGDGLRVGPRLRRGVSFVRRDLVHGPPAGRYDLVLCKNVLIYFGAEARERALKRLLASLTQSGVLLVARSEVPLARAVGAEVVDLGAGVVGFRGP